MLFLALCAPLHEMKEDPVLCKCVVSLVELFSLLYDYYYYYYYDYDYDYDSDSYARGLLGYWHGGSLMVSSCCSSLPLALVIASAAVAVSVSMLSCWLRELGRRSLVPLHEVGTRFVMRLAVGSFIYNSVGSTAWAFYECARMCVCPNDAEYKKRGTTLHSLLIGATGYSSHRSGDA